MEDLKPLAELHILLSTYKTVDLCLSYVPGFTCLSFE